MCTLFLFLHTKNLTSRLREMEDRLQPSALNSGNDLNDYPAHQGKLFVKYVNLMLKSLRIEKRQLTMQKLENVYCKLHNRTIESVG